MRSPGVKIALAQLVEQFEKLFGHGRYRSETAEQRPAHALMRRRQSNGVRTARRIHFK